MKDRHVPPGEVMPTLLVGGCFQAGLESFEAGETTETDRWESRLESAGSRINEGFTRWAGFQPVSVADRLVWSVVPGWRHVGARGEFC